jgi:beta-mannosidase
VQEIHLNGSWWLRHADPGEGQRLAWPAGGVAGRESIPAQVPGDVHLDLVASGVIEEPLYARNALNCVWIETRDWWYSREFELPPGFLGDRVELHFDGLDTTADIWLNGRHVGVHNNMFVSYTVDVTDAVRGGRNLLVVRLDVGLRAVADKDSGRYDGMTPDNPPGSRMWIRKAQFTFGWDWAPRLLTCGIWRGVTLRSYRSAALRDVYLRTFLQTDGSARVVASMEVENLSGGDLPVQIRVSLGGHGEHTCTAESVLSPGRHAATAEVALLNPTLWWPAPLGAPALYDCRVTVASGERILDERAMQYGVREVALLREPLGDEGESFVIAVNGRRVFCKGADWVPADALLPRVSRAKYRALVLMAADANFNMLRIWGGGVYEDPYFYELCDQFGILVWQDFMYACSYYPDDDDAFLSEARREAEAAVRALRNYACLALWCGNNENQWIHFQRVREHRGAERCTGQALYDTVLPDVCSRLDPGRPYWPSSPYCGDDPNSELCGDRHSWGVGILNPTLESRIDYRSYAADRGKFISEFGVLAPPSLESLQRFLPPGEVRRDSESWAFHNNAFEAGTIQTALTAYWRSPDQLSLEDYLRYAQLIQAEALAYALAHWRRRAFKTGGALFWMYSDCWGAVGWTVVDYYLRTKPSYYAVRRVFAPVLSSIAAATDGTLSLWLTNDTMQDVEGALEYGLVDLRTARRQEHRIAARASACTSVQVEQIAVAQAQLSEPGRWVAYCRFAIDDVLVSGDRWFLPGFHLSAVDFPKAQFVWRLEEDRLIVSAQTYVWQLQLATPREVCAEDNYFDLLPGEERQIQLRGPRARMQDVTVTALNA